MRYTGKYPVRSTVKVRSYFEGVHEMGAMYLSEPEQRKTYLQRNDTIHMMERQFQKGAVIRRGALSVFFC